MYYAQLNSNGIVIGISELSGQVDNPNMISISSFDVSLIGKKWNGQHFISA